MSQSVFEIFAGEYKNDKNKKGREKNVSCFDR